MSVFFIASGALLIVAAVLDAFKTTLVFAGGGPLTERLTGALWKVILAWHRKRGSQSHGLLRSAGSLILLTIVAVWITMVFAGYLLIFASQNGAVVQSATGAAADWAERFYFTGYTLFTLGLGDYIPGNDTWRIVTIIATVNGLFLVTLAITYLLPVVSAAAQRHQLGAVVSNLGLYPQEIVARVWDGNRFEGLNNYLVQITPMIDLHSQLHLAYPVLHYFHSVRRRTAAAPSLATLHEALLILCLAVPKEYRPAAAYLDPTRRALDGLLEILSPQYIRKHKVAPPLPDLTALRAQGIPLVSDAEFREAAAAGQDRRKLLLAYVENGGWTWNDVSPT